MLQVVPLLAAMSAAAASPAAPEARAATRRGAAESGMLGGLGVMGGDSMGGMAFSGMLTHRYDLFEVGVEANAAVLFSSLAGVGGLVGVHLGADLSLRVLVGGGVHYYHHVGAGFLNDDPGVSGSLPFLGQRLLLGYSLGKKTWKNRGFLGVLAALDEDVGRQTKTVSYLHTNWLFDSNSYQETATHRLGQTSFWALLMAGVELDLLPY